MAAGKTLRILPGLLILALGAALLLHNLDLLDLGGLRSFWPLAVIAFGLHLFFGGANRAFGLAVAALGVALQGEMLGWFDVPWGRVRDFWPLILIAVGASMLLRGRKDSLVGGVILVSLGAYFQGRNLAWIDFEIWNLWPVAVIAAGLGMVQKTLRG